MLYKKYTWIENFIRKDSLLVVSTVYIYDAILFFFFGWLFDSLPMIRLFQYVGGAAILNVITIAAVGGLMGRPVFINYSAKQLQEEKQKEENQYSYATQKNVSKENCETFESVDQDDVTLDGMVNASKRAGEIIHRKKLQ